MSSAARPLAPSNSNSSDYFGSDDPEFLAALQTAVLPGDLPIAESGEKNDQGTLASETVSSGLGLKRMRSRSGEQSPVPTGAQAGESSDIYGPSHFGNLGEYMQRKRAKLQIQNSRLADTDEALSGADNIFSGLAIYINGWTEPSIQDLRQLIVKHGGVFHAYLDRKSLVTHILTCSLTPAKIKEFKNMKVVKPAWLVESAAAGVLLPWTDYIYLSDDRMDTIDGTKSAQTRLPRVSRIPSSVTSRNSSVAPRNTNIAPVSIGTSAPKHPAPVASTSSVAPDITDPIYMTDPATKAQAARVPGYAAQESNLHAQRAMANPGWRAAHTSVAPDFIEGFYKNSRLHHLATWKAELRGLVAEAQERAESAAELAPTAVAAAAGDGVSMRGAELVLRSPSKKDKGKGKAREQDDTRVIMHCDFDCFFVAAGLVSRPHLRGKPVVVCHSQGGQGGAASTSEIASSSYEARSFGVKNGMSLQQARKLCPTIITIPYEFERYKQLSLKFYTILMSHADDLQAVSVDEALVETTGSVARYALQNPCADPAKEFAETLRAQIKESTGCEVSIGISYNIMLARLATRRAKPAGAYHLVQAEVPDFMAPLEITDLHGFGYSTKEKALEKLGTTCLGVLAEKSQGVLCDALGKGMGETLYKAIRGIDDRKLESDKPRKSVSCEINYGIRFENDEQVKQFLYEMGEEVARRLDKIDKVGRSITLKIMKRDPTAPVEAPKFLGHGICNYFNKQMPLSGPAGRATSDPRVIGDHAWRLMQTFGFDPKELRGIGIQIQKLESSDAMPAVGQGKLPFAVKNQTTAPQVVVHPPSDSAHPDDTAPTRSDNVLDLPSFSQVDMSVFNALPDDVRTELEAEYKRRSISPFVAQAPQPPPPRANSAAAPAIRKITVKGINVKRAVRQLAPRPRAQTSPLKRRRFARRSPSPPRPSPTELRALGIDPTVFALLPLDVQREQLAGARFTKVSGQSVLLGEKRQVIKPYKRWHPPYPKLPPPQARGPERIVLKQQGPTRGEKVCFTETNDVQSVVAAWVQGYRSHAPHQRDVDAFAKFLVQSADSARATDSGVAKTVAVLKWWQLLLRRHWGPFEDDDDDEVIFTPDTSEVVGRAWWAAFRETKQKVDVVARKKFGGCLSLR